jgi:hypothetical protein
MGKYMVKARGFMLTEITEIAEVESPPAAIYVTINNTN